MVLEKPPLELKPIFKNKKNLNNMRFLLTNLLLLLSIVGVQAQEAAKARWFRPINVGKADYRDVVVAEGDTVRFFKGEWLETTAEKEGNVILGGNKGTLMVDKQSICIYKERTKEESFYPLGLECTADNKKISVKTTNGETVVCQVINQTKNKIIKSQFSIPGAVEDGSIDKNDELRFAFENRASVVVPVSKIAGYGVQKEKAEDNGKNHALKKSWKEYLIYIIIGTSLLVLAIVGVIVWILVKRRKCSTPNNDPEQEGHEPTEPEESLEEQLDRCQAELVATRSRVKSLEKEKATVESALTRAEESLATVEAKVQSVQQELEQKYSKEIDSLRQDVQTVKTQAQNEKTAMISQFEAEKTALNNTIAEQADNLTATQTELATTRTTLQDTEVSLSNANAKIESLNCSLTKFNTILTEVPFAKRYSAIVVKFLNLANEINSSAIRMLELDVDDPYFLMKYISRYAKALSNVDMLTLTAELRMLEMGDMVLVGSTLATYNKNNSAEDLESSTRQYFFTSYLQKMIDALVVLNESMAGADRLVDGVEEGDVAVFANYRTQIEDICGELGVIVENVRLFDKVGEKIDLSAELVDINASTGDIVDMENAVVYLQGSIRPEIKVKVKVQE